MKQAGRIALAYALIAGIATLANIAVQAIAVRIYTGPYSIPASVAAGTAAGLPLKYALEKQFIFAFRARDLVHEGRLFLLYTFFGAFTTALFWSTEYVFHIVFRTEPMRLLGAALGLTLGSFVKYHLDKRLVFVRSAEAPR